MRRGVGWLVLRRWAPCWSAAWRRPTCGGGASVGWATSSAPSSPAAADLRGLVGVGPRATAAGAVCGAVTGLLLIASYYATQWLASARTPPLAQLTKTGGLPGRRRASGVAP
ncbi:MAG: hypothetical protein R2734_02795 [Nocardioides sp.]